MTDRATFLIDDADVPAVRNVMSHLAQIGYNELQVRERLALKDLKDLAWRAVPIYRKVQLAVRDVLATAIDLFLLQGALSPEELDGLFEKPDQDLLVRAGLLAIDDQGFARARASLFPVGTRLVFSDHAWPKLPHPGCVDVPHDQVMFVGSDSRWLARATVRRSVGSTLDLCTGSGVHAILAASHSQLVHAVDISPRAALCTRFNAQAAGATNVEVSVGNLFEPVHGECFDLITANPPFVPSPLNSIGYRDGGLSGEDVQKEIIEGLPHHLAPGGMAQIVTELGEREGESIADRLRSWLGDAPMDILILRLQEISAASYAMGHAQGDYDFGELLDSVEDWFDNLQTQGYSRIVSVLLAFQWSDPTFGPPWIRMETTQPPLSNAGTEIEAMFAAERQARDPRLFESLEQSRVRRVGPIGLREGRVLGGDLRATPEAQALGKALASLQWLDPIEREVLVLIEQPLMLSELIVRAGGLNLEETAVMAAVRSLIRRNLITLVTGDQNSIVHTLRGPV